MDREFPMHEYLIKLNEAHELQELRQSEKKFRETGHPEEKKIDQISSTKMKGELRQTLSAQHCVCLCNAKSQTK